MGQSLLDQGVSQERITQLHNLFTTIYIVVLVGAVLITMITMIPKVMTQMKENDKELSAAMKIAFADSFKIIIAVGIGCIVVPIFFEICLPLIIGAFQQ